jgi:hypothetical protein
MITKIGGHVLLRMINITGIGAQGVIRIITEQEY